MLGRFAPTATWRLASGNETAGPGISGSDRDSGSEPVLLTLGDTVIYGRASPDVHARQHWKSRSVSV